jgi:hypothetical protein
MIFDIRDIAAVATILAFVIAAGSVSWRIGQFLTRLSANDNILKEAVADHERRITTLEQEG